MTDISDDHRRIADAVLDAFGGELPKVMRYLDEPEEHHVNLAMAADVPVAGVTSYSTLGLSDTPLVDAGKEFGLRVELVGGCESVYDKFANVLSTAAFNIIKDEWFVYPGRIFPEVVAMYYPDLSMRHLLFLSPSVWNLDALELSDKTVAWLHAVPISEDEARYASRQAQVSGDDQALEKLLIRADIDAFNLDRPSVI